MVDARPPAAHVGGHIPGSLSIPLDESFGTWLGWVVDLDRPVVLVVDGRRRPRRADAPGAAHRPRRDRRLPRGRLRALGRRRAGRSRRAAGAPSTSLAAALAGDPARRRRCSSTSARRPSTRPATSRARGTSTAGRCRTGSPSCPATGPSRRSARPASGRRSRRRCCARPGSRTSRGWIAGLPGVGRGRLPGGIRRRGRPRPGPRRSPPEPVPTRPPLKARTSVPARHRTDGPPSERGARMPPSAGERCVIPIGEREPGVSGSRPAAPPRTGPGPSLFRRLLGGEVDERAPRSTPPGDRSIARGRARRAARHGPRASPSDWPPRTTARSCSGRSSTRRSAPFAPTATTIRILHDDRLDVAAWAGLPDELAARLPVFHRDEGWVGEVLRTGRVLAFPDVRADRHPRLRALRRRRRVRRRPHRAAHPPRPGHRRADGRHLRAARLDERRRRVHHDARDARGHRADQRRAVRADRGARRPARRPPGGLGPAEPGRTRSRASAGRSSRRPAGSSTTTTPGCTWSSPRRRRPDRVRGDGRAPTSRSTSSSCAASSARASPAGSPSTAKPLLINDANADPRGATIAGHRRRRRIDARRADALRPGDRRRHHALQARPRPVRPRRPAAADDPRRPGRDGRRVGAAAGPDPGPRRRAAPAARHERRAVREPRPAPGREPDGRPPRPGDGRRRVRDQLLGPRRPAGSTRSGYYPPNKADEMEPVLRRRRLSGDAPGPRAPGDGHHRRRRPGRRPGRGRAAPTRGQPGRCAMLPLVAKGQSIGLVELFSRIGHHLGRRAAAARPARWPTRRRWRSRTPGSTRTPATAPTATR